LVICEIHTATERWEDHVDVIGENIWPNIAYNYKPTQQKGKEQTSGKKIIRLEQGSVTNNTTKNFKLQK
jgi:hypothetical protein